MSHLASAFCLSHPSRNTTLVTAYCIADTLKTGTIETLTGRLISIVGTVIVSTPRRTLFVDNHDVFLSHERAVAAVRERMRARVQQLQQRIMWREA